MQNSKFGPVIAFFLMLTGRHPVTVTYTDNQKAGLIKVFQQISLPFEQLSLLRTKMSEVKNLFENTPLWEYIMELVAYDNLERERFSPHRAFLYAFENAPNPVTDRIGRSTTDQRLAYLDILGTMDLNHDDTDDTIDTLIEFARTETDNTILKNIGVVIGKQSTRVQQNKVNKVAERANPGTAYMYVFDGMTEALQQRILDVDHIQKHNETSREKRPIVDHSIPVIPTAAHTSRNTATSPQVA